MQANVSLHTRGELPRVRSGRHDEQPHCYLSLNWSGADLDLHVHSPAELIAMARRIEAEGLRLEAELVARPGYTPTPEEAMRHPREFVEGMEETSGVHCGLPPF